MSATQAASDDLKQQMKQVDKPRMPKGGRGKAAKEAKKPAEPEPEASDLEKEGPEESLPSPSGAPYVESPSEAEEDDDDDVFKVISSCPLMRRRGWTPCWRR